MKAQRDLAVDLEGKPIGYLCARVSKRMSTDLFARGVSRGAVECFNLVHNAETKDATRAESVKSAPSTEMSLAYPLRLLQSVAAAEPWPAEPARAIAERRARNNPNITTCPFWTLYGARGQRMEASLDNKDSSFTTPCVKFFVVRRAVGSVTALDDVSQTH